MQTKLKKTTKHCALSILLITLTTQTLNAAECTPLIEACDKALEAKNKQIQLSDLALRQTVDRLARVELEFKNERESASSWYRSPFLYFTGGFIVSMLLVNLRK